MLDLKLLLRLKDEEIKMLNKDVTKLSERVSDYNEIEAHNTDLQSELFSRDRFVYYILWWTQKNIFLLPQYPIRSN